MGILNQLRHSKMTYITLRKFLISMVARPISSTIQRKNRLRYLSI